jgi:hypothetical protein
MDEFTPSIDYNCKNKEQNNTKESITNNIENKINLRQNIDDLLKNDKLLVNKNF